MDIMTITYHWLRHTLVGVMLLLPTAVGTAAYRTRLVRVPSSQWYAAHVEPRTPYAPLPVYSECWRPLAAVGAEPRAWWNPRRPWKPR